MSFFTNLFRKKKDDPGLISFADYAERYAEFVRAARPGDVVTVERGAQAATTFVSWTMDDGVKVNHFMGNWYSQYQQQPEDMDDLFASQLQGALNAQGRFDKSEAGMECILPVIKTVAWQETTTAQLDAANVPRANHPLSVPFTGDLVVAYVEDTPDEMSYIAASRLDILGLDLPALQALAIDNLSRRLPDLRVEGGDGRYAARLDRNYDASMVLLLEQWDKRPDVSGERVIAIAARDEVLVCGSNDLRGIESLKAIASEIMATSAYGLSDQLFVWRDGRLQEYTEWRHSA